MVKSVVLRPDPEMNLKSKNYNRFLSGLKPISKISANSLKEIV